MSVTRIVSNMKHLLLYFSVLIVFLAVSEVKARDVSRWKRQTEETDTDELPEDFNCQYCRYCG